MVDAQFLNEYRLYERGYDFPVWGFIVLILFISGVAFLVVYLLKKYGYLKEDGDDEQIIQKS